MSRPFRFGVQARGPSDGSALSALARRAEELGYSTLTVADHLDDLLAPVPALAVAAAATTTLRVGTLVLANDFRHPAIVAKEAATLDVISGGRLELGVGAGWRTDDYTQTGISLDRPSVRIARLGESIAIMKALFAKGSVQFNGEHYSIQGLEGVPKPVQLPHPPILVGGGGEQILTLAGQAADIVGINPNLAAGVIDRRAGPTATVEATELKLSWVRRAAGDRFDHIELQTRIHMAMLTDDRAGVAQAIAPALGIDPDDAYTSPHAVVGTVDECVDHLERTRERFGISYITWGSDAMESMAPVVERLAGR